MQFVQRIEGWSTNRSHHNPIFFFALHIFIHWYDMAASMYHLTVLTPQQPTQTFMFETYTAAIGYVHTLIKDHQPLGAVESADTTVFTLPTYTIKKVSEYYTVLTTDRFYESHRAYFTTHAAAVEFAVAALQASTVENLNDHAFELTILKSNPTG